MNASDTPKRTWNTTTTITQECARTRRRRRIVSRLRLRIRLECAPGKGDTDGEQTERGDGENVEILGRRPVKVIVLVEIHGEKDGRLQLCANHEAKQSRREKHVEHKDLQYGESNNGNEKNTKSTSKCSHRDRRLKVHTHTLHSQSTYAQLLGD